jgi:NTE family protein
MSLRAHPPGGRERIDVIRSRIRVAGWPDRDLRITAVEAETGRRQAGEVLARVAAAWTA